MADSLKGMSGYYAGMLTAFILQPLQNVKILLILPPKNLQLTDNFTINFDRCIRYLYNEGKIYSFYKGVILNVIKTGYSSSIFFSSLRFYQKRMLLLSPQNPLFCSFVSSFLGRIKSTILSNPLSMVETRYQISGPERISGSIYRNIIKIYNEEGIRAFFKGCLASCYKEGFFAGIYYAMYAKGKKMQMPPAVTGMVCGISATLITHPFQIIRASLQSQKKTKQYQPYRIPLSIFQLLKDGRLWAGIAPRLAKKPLANTISFLFFQAIQKIQKFKG